MTVVRELFIIFGLVACGRSEVRSPTTPCPSCACAVSTVAPVVSAAPSSSATPPPAIVEAIPTLTLPAKVACAFDTKDTKQVIALHASPDKPTYGLVESGPLRLTFSTTGAPIAELLGGAIELRGHASVFSRPHPQAFLRAAGPLVLAGVFSVAPGTVLSVAGGAAGELLPVVPDLHIVVPKTSFEAHPCADFALDQAKFDPRSALPKTTGKLLNLTRYTSHDAPIAVTATAPPVATVRAGEKVTELKRDTGRSLITATTEQGVLFGWIATTDLDEGPAGLGLVGLAGPAAKYAQGISSAKPTARACSHDVRIAWVHDGAMTFLGRVRAGSTFHYRVRENLGELAAMPTGVVLQAGVLAIPLGELIDCKEK